jgi:dTDP-4-dehydrorhamnose reductase
MAWVTGAGGLIGEEIVRVAGRRELPWRVRALTRGDVDLLDYGAVESEFKRDKPAVIIHCAALSRSPACERNRDLARRMNIEVTRQLLDLSAGAPFVFFSTDLIFDGEKGNYTEEDEPNPLMVYGETKLEAEQLLRGYPEPIVLRISLTGGISRTRDRGFNEEIENAWKQNKSLNLFTDEFRCPMPAEVPARATWDLLLAKARGCYHLCGKEKLSRHQIGVLMAEKHPELNPQITAGSRLDYHGSPRPRDTSMDCSKIQRLLAFEIPGFSEWLKSSPSDF